MSKIADFPAYVVGKFLKCTGASAISWEDLTIPAGSITQTEIGNAAVGQGELKTSTGSASGAIGAETYINIAMSAYCFFPMIYGSTSLHLRSHGTNGASPDAPRFAIYNPASTEKTYNIQWRYIIA